MSKHLTKFCNFGRFFLYQDIFFCNRQGEVLEFRILKSTSSPEKDILFFSLFDVNFCWCKNWKTYRVSQIAQLHNFEFFAPIGQSRVWQMCIGAKNQFLFEMVQKDPDWSKRVPNSQKHICWSFWSLFDSFWPFWNVDKPTMFCHFWSKMDHF